MNYAGLSQPITYSGKLRDLAGTIISNSKVDMLISIFRDKKMTRCFYSETNQVVTGVNGEYRIDIGSGKKISGEFATINWSDSSFYLILGPDTAAHGKRNFFYAVQLRAPTELRPENLEGIAQADTAKEYGSIVIQHNRNMRPKKITVDLTSSYANVRYPADTYPIYRHLEWYDEDRNGRGNSFVLSYSENTTNAFFEDTEKIGDVKLYTVPFQELFVKEDTNTITITMTKPHPIENLNQTYAIKGPWKIIYFIEW